MGDGKHSPVKFFGYLDVFLHCKEDLRVLLSNIAVVPKLAVKIIFFTRIRERYDVLLNRRGAATVWGRFQLKKHAQGNSIQANRVAPADTRPNNQHGAHAMAAAEMRPRLPLAAPATFFRGRGH